VACWPEQIEAGSVTHETVLTMDWFPTFVNLAGGDVNPPKPLDGTDVGPLMLESGEMPKRTVFWRYRGQKAARRGRWKLMLDDDERMLFDMEQDVTETIDLREEQPQVAEDLAGALRAWEAELPTEEEMRTG
jgi:arylsulfatase A-like enzyme